MFDGPAPVPAPPGADVRFSGAGTSADSLILRFLRTQPERAGWTVVTNDRSLGDRCRSIGAKVERCDAFRKRWVERCGDEKPAPSDDIDYWLEVFREDTRPRD